MSMARDVHPTADDTATPPERGRQAVEEGSGPVRVTGNPTARELAAVTAAVAATRRAPAVADVSGESTDTTASGPGGDPGRPTATDADPEETAADANPDSRERVTHERRCPVCRKQYDSTRRLDGATTLRTTGRGASTVCVDPGSKRVYVHSPPPR